MITFATSVETFDTSLGEMVGMRHDDWVRAGAVERYGSGESLRDTAELYGVSVGTVRRWVVADGGSLRGMGRNGKAVDRGEVEVLWRDGLSMREISRRVGVSRGRVRRLLCEWGLLCWGGEYVI